MRRAGMYSTILVAALAIGTAGPASAGQSGSAAGSGGQSGSPVTGAGQPGTSGTGSGQSGASGGQAGTSGAGDNTAIASGGQSGATSPQRDDRQDFIEKAALANMAEIQLGQLASSNAQDPQVKQFAQMMVTDHTQALDQLRSAAGSTTLPSSLDKKHQKLYDKLSKLQGAEFDRAYMNAMVDGHKNVEKLLSKRAGDKEHAGASDSSHGQTAMAGSTGAHGTPAEGSSSSGSASGTAGTSGSGNTSGATGTSGTGTPSQSGDASGTMSGSTSGSSTSGAVGTSGSSSSYASGASSTPGSVDEWASMTLPKVRSHLEQAKALENQVKQQHQGANPAASNKQGEQPPKQ